MSIDKMKFYKELTYINDNEFKKYLTNLFSDDIIYKVKIVCNWTSSEEIFNIWKKFSQDNNGKWNNIQLTINDDYDYIVIINNPPNDLVFDNKKAIIVHMEPYWERDYGKINDDKYFKTLLHRNSINIAEWNINKTYSELLNSQFNNKIDAISTILSPKYNDIGQIKRIDFVKYIEKHLDIDVFGNNKWEYKNFKGDLPYHQKDNALIPYKYTFNCENNSIRNYCTEKLYDGILSECLTFYSGCPNIREIIDERAYVYLNLVNFEEDMNTIITAIKEDWWTQRIQYIREAKKKILNKLQIFPILYKNINNTK